LTSPQAGAVPALAALVSPALRGNPRYRPVVWTEGVLSEAECEHVVGLYAPESSRPASTGAASSANAQSRRASVQWIVASDEAWLCDRVLRLVDRWNESVFRFDLTGLDDHLQLARYDVGDFHDWHQDLGRGPPSRRKLSVSIVLSAPEDYSGGALRFPDHVGAASPPDWEPGRSPRGSAAVFPSFQLHRVDPVAEGRRWSLVAWVAGPPFR
jgi:PKHD-type hydroxylase